MDSLALCMCVIVSLAAPLSWASISPVERRALIHLYHATGGPGWKDKDHWLTDSDPCTTPWHGVICEMPGTHVISINLQFNNLNGHLPPTFGNMSKMQTLILNNNPNLKGPLPTSIGEMDLMQIMDFEGCQLSGPIPPTFCNLYGMYVLDLGGNKFTSIPKCFCDKAMPSRACNMSKNAFKCPLPTCATKWCAATCH
eukprot:TRINITY_DN47296_c0_g1_i1.p1 TRINITY_DN47296_c0_g1~~TRINITY_DN47296_c0_g1_i1.p1  ORF type:complete len:197 (+),score=4.73 TRINITY_DN47296_c0_g1_i1:28-618(+)